MFSLHDGGRRQVAIDHICYRRGALGLSLSAGSRAGIRKIEKLGRIIILLVVIRARQVIRDLCDVSGMQRVQSQRREKEHFDEILHSHSITALQPVSVFSPRVTAMLHTM